MIGQEFMRSYYVGKKHTELTEWLLQTWLKEGPPICFIEGFSGVGKSTVARTVVQDSGWDYVNVDMPEVTSDQVDNLFLNLATALANIGIDDLSNAVMEGKSLEEILPSIFIRKVLIIIDEFQNALDETGKPVRPVMSLLEKLAFHYKIPGRILFLSNQTIERSRWSEAYEIRILKGLVPTDAEKLLDHLLIMTDRSEEIPKERRRDVVKWLGENPRAIHVLVASLEKSSLDELIGISPEIWEARDRDVSAELLRKLERELLERTIHFLAPTTGTLLRRLSVHRKAFQRAAFESQLSKNSKFETIRDNLINRFLMEQHLGWYSLNPIVREISLQRLKEKPSELKKAHARAADYFMRHFKAKEIVDNGKLGSYFVEARYHLVQSQRDDELIQIAGRFENHLKSRFSSSSFVPSQLDELNERIATLTALLETPGAKGLESYLSRLYEARGAESDLRKALSYLQRATDSVAPAQDWVRRLRLEAKFSSLLELKSVAREAIAHVSSSTGDVVSIYIVAGKSINQAGDTKDAILFLKDGIEKIPAEKNLGDLYSYAGELLAQIGEFDEAITLLKEGIAKNPPDKVKIFLAVGKILDQEGKTSEAITFLRNSIDEIPADKNVDDLYVYIGELLVRTGKIEEAITLFKEGITKIPPDKDIRVIYQSAGELIAQTGKTDEAIALLREGIAIAPKRQSLFSLYQSAGKILAQAGKVNEAVAFLKEGISIIPKDSLYSLYQSAGEILAQSGKPEEAITLLKAGISIVPPDKNLYSLYQSAGEILAQSGKPEEAITLLKAGISIVSEHGKPLLEKTLLILKNKATQIKDVLPPYQVGNHEVFVSYAWGDESEKIADDLDQAFKNRGVIIVRDKRDLGFRGRIKSFMETIGKGKAIILVISDKYLKSENCLFELLQTAKHGNFEGRIFPVVLGDAKIYRPIDRIRYVQFWEQQLKELDDAMKTVSATNMQGFREDIDLYAEIRANLPRLTDVLKDMNTLTPAIHRDANFQTLFDAVMAKLQE
jgi:tetratricopeptide (TPR) repeat protein